MIEVKLDREYYSIHQNIISWCTNQFGPGLLFDESRKVTSIRWSTNILFGTQFYYFQEEKDAILFSLKWVGAK